MVSVWLFGTVLVSFFVTLFIMPFWIRKAKQIGLVWENMNKFNKEKNMAGSGGTIAVLGTLIGIFVYIAIQTFVFKSSDGVITEIFAIVSSLFLVAGIGLIDDLFGWQRGGMSIRSRLILVLFAAIPLMVINAGNSSIAGINLGLLYPLIIIPLGVVGATTTYNFLAGYNGLEARQGILILGALALASYLQGNSWLSLIALIMVASLVAFYVFNRYPAKVLPGDVMTYSIGIMIAAIAILGNLELVAVLFFIPYIIETILKARGGLKKYSFGKPNPDGSLDLLYDKFYGLEHIALYVLKKIKPSHKVYEKDVVNLINGFQIVIILLVLLFMHII
ncbi:MAG: glycosyl transferase family 4 [Candidatus Pacearchaeota archaeon]|nr:glycosyl transferase family 4 [Candidatus Pacearchaeota archaeon]